MTTANLSRTSYSVRPEELVKAEYVETLALDPRIRILALGLAEALTILAGGINVAAKALREFARE